MTLYEAVLGGKIRVPTLDGAVEMAIPAGTNSGRVLRLKGKGVHKKDGSRGDQLVTLMIDLPSDDAALQQFADGWQDPRNPRAAMGV